MLITSSNNTSRTYEKTFGKTTEIIATKLARNQISIREKLTLDSGTHHDRLGVSLLQFLVDDPFPLLDDLFFHVALSLDGFTR